MVEIEFSVMEGESGRANPLLPLLEAFKEQYNIQVKLTRIPWERGGLKLLNLASTDKGQMFPV